MRFISIPKMIIFGEIFEDDAQIIYVNGQKKDSNTELGRLMQDFFEPDPEKMNYRMLATQARRLKYSEEGLEMVREYLTEEEWNTALQQGIERGTEQGIKQGMEQGMAQGMEQGLEQGLERGEAQKAIRIATSLLSLGKITKEEIAACTGLSVEEVENLS